MERGLSSGGHYLGIQPWGNYYLNPQKTIRQDGLGDLSLFSDEIVLKILELLDPKSLASLALVSKAFLCFAYFEEFWKSFVLQEYVGHFLYTINWRWTYISQHKDIRDCHEQWQPLIIKGFYSDLLYQPWFCANMIIPEEWLCKDNTPRRSNLTREEFRRDFESPNKPVILTGAMDEWKSYQLWNRHYLVECLQEHEVLVGNYPMKFAYYIQYCDEQQDEMPLYLFDKNILSKHPVLQTQYKVPEVFEEDLFAALGSQNRPDYRWLIMGPQRSGSSFHKDPNCTSAWNAVIQGSKKWILYPPHIIPPGVHQSPDQSEVATSISLMEWFLNFYQETKSRKVKPVECVLKAGEILFIPRGWWHIAMNLEESIAITQNFVSSINLPRVLDFLESKQASLVSGLPIYQREHLYDNFLEALQQKHPTELRQALEHQVSTRKRPFLQEDDTFLKKSKKNTETPFKFDFF